MCCTVLYELKPLQSVHGESDTDAITGVETSNNNRLYQSSHSSVWEVSSDAVYLPDVYGDWPTNVGFMFLEGHSIIKCDPKYFNLF